MKFAWHSKIEDLAGCNLEQVEEVELGFINKYTEMIDVDESAAEFDRLEDEYAVLD